MIRFLPRTRFLPFAVVLVACVVCVAGMATVARACENCKGNKKAGTYIGETAILGNGTVRSWVTLNEAGKPTAVGVTFTETALSGLRRDKPPVMPGWEYRLMLPKEANATAFKHVTVDWNPAGHIPPGIYDTPHFDFHFFMITPKERERITAKGQDRLVCRKAPPAQYQARDYIFAPDSEEPGMGGHWVDPTSPELNGQPFTRTFIYGFYDGRKVFFEPMISLEYLKSKPSVTEPIKLPAKYAVSGYYPTKYSVRYDPLRQEYTVSLDEMVLR